MQGLRHVRALRLYFVRFIVVFSILIILFVAFFDVTTRCLPLSYISPVVSYIVLWHGNLIVLFRIIFFKSFS